MTSINGNVIPEILTGPIQGGTGGYTRAEKIEAVIKHELQDLCAKYEVNKTTVGNIFVSSGLVGGADCYMTEFNELRRLLLRSTQTDRTTKLRRMYECHSFIFSLNNKGKWVAEEILGANEYLSKAKVEKAFAKAAKAKDWKLDDNEAILCSCMVDGYPTYAWIACARGGILKQWHTMAILPQNGLFLIDKTSEEMPVDADARICIADGVLYQRYENGKLSSLTSKAY